MSVAYAVTPQQAYTASGAPRGLLGASHGRCTNCAGHLRAYSAAGVSELAITHWCEPCFDYLTATEDDRDPWMARVRDRRAPMATCAHPAPGRTRQPARACLTRMPRAGAPAA